MTLYEIAGKALLEIGKHLDFLNTLVQEEPRVQEDIARTKHGMVRIFNRFRKIKGDYSVG